MGRRPQKKSDTLEVRIPHEVKDALMQKAQAEGRSASDVVRAFIDCYLAGQPKEARSMFLTLWKPAAAVGAASLALMWATLAPTPIQASPNLKSVFQMLDRNHDGAITIDEFMRDASDPAVEKMHHAHMASAHGGQMTAMHAQMTGHAHGAASEQALRAHFAEVDANSDGSIAFGEFKAFHDKMKAAHGH